MELDEVLIEPLVIKVLSGFVSKEHNWFCGLDIPEKKQKESIKAYGIQPPFITNEKVIGLIDATAFGSAKDGILFGSKSGLYYKYDGHGLKGHIPYSELAFTPEDKIQKPVSTIHFSGRHGWARHYLYCLETNQLLKLLLELRSELRDAAGLSDGRVRCK